MLDKEKAMRKILNFNDNWEFFKGVSDPQCH